MQRYSAFALARRALKYHQGWERAWASPSPRRHYKVIVVGAGGHGLATAYYLAKNHGIREVAVLEKGWLGGGNTGRNTTIIRSNYLQPASTAVYKLAHQLYEDLSEEKTTRDQPVYYYLLEDVSTSGTVTLRGAEARNRCRRCPRTAVWLPSPGSGQSIRKGRSL